MPIYKGTIFKQFTFGGQPGPIWSNSYNISAPTLADAAATTTTLRLLEQAVSYSDVHFLYNVTRENVLHGASRRDVVDTNGSLDPTGLGGPLPLFCTVLVTFSDNVKKPEQKYLRLGANESNLTLGVWDAEFTAFIKTNYADQVIATLPYVGPSGEHPTVARVHTPVQNRQLGWHRRGRPGFKRGWVPV